ncbi:MAG: hypothetical protein JWO52_4682, partial [Gammaproteobacteria bacterium]|nr:hypothetical protein [Gammaproteobacteria bacterium]
GAAEGRRGSRGPAGRTPVRARLAWAARCWGGPGMGRQSAGGGERGQVSGGV